MADSRLKLQIVTALDNAGIKATEDQISQLESSLRKVNQTGSTAMDGLSKSVTSLPGQLGKVVESFGKIGTAAGIIRAAIAVFEDGRKIGQQIREWAGETWEWAQTFDQVQQKIHDTEQLMSDAKNQEIQMVQKVAQIKADLANKEDTTYNKAIKRIDDQTKALFRQAEAIQKIKDAKDNAQVLKMELQKFHEAASYREVGQDDIADQIEKAWNVSIAKTKKTIEEENFDTQTNKLAKGKYADEDKFLKVMDNLASAERALERERDKLAQIGKTDRGDKYKAQEKAVEAAENRFDKLWDKANDLGLKVQENWADDDKRAIERAVLEAKGSFDVEKAMSEYNRFVGDYYRKRDKSIEDAEKKYYESISSARDSYTESISSSALERERAAQRRSIDDRYAEQEYLNRLNSAESDEEAQKMMLEHDMKVAKQAELDRLEALRQQDLVSKYGMSYDKAVDKATSSYYESLSNVKGNLLDISPDEGYQERSLDILERLVTATEEEKELLNGLFEFKK